MEIKLIDRLFCLNEDEFLLLAGSFGIREIHGFEMRHNENGKLNEEQIKRSIFSLCRKEILSSSGDGFKTTPELKSIFQSIKDAGKVITVEYMDEEKEPLCIYVSDEAIVYMKPATDGVDYVHLGIGDEKELSEFLTVSEILPEGKKDEEMDLLWEEIEKSILLPEQKIESLHNKIALIMIKDVASKEVIAKTAVFRSGNDMFCLFDSRKSGRSVKYYQKNALIESICHECAEAVEESVKNQ